MNVYIENVTLLKNRLADFISIAKQVLAHRKGFLWAKCEMKNGHCVIIPLATAKKSFEAHWIDRYQKALDCLNGKDFTTIDWIDLRDVLYHVLFALDMQGEKSMAALRQSKKDIIIEVYNNDNKQFAADLARFRKS